MTQTVWYFVMKSGMANVTCLNYNDDDSSICDAGLSMFSSVEYSNNFESRWLKWSWCWCFPILLGKRYVGVVNWRNSIILQIYWLVTIYDGCNGFEQKVQQLPGVCCIRVIRQKKKKSLIYDDTLHTWDWRRWRTRWGSGSPNWTSLVWVIQMRVTVMIIVLQNIIRLRHSFDRGR